MITTRMNHTATLLLNGRVLIAGGNNTGILTNSELYDPVAKTWTKTGGLNTARNSHTATLLPNGQVLVAGGTGGGNTAELYDPTTGIWTSTGTMNHSRSGHTETLLSNGQVLVVGGDDGNGGLTNAEIYVPATGTWVETGGMHSRRTAHTATLLPNGKVLVAGGIFANTVLNYLSTAEIYDPIAGTWQVVNSMTTARSAHIATLLANGQVLIAGGANAPGGVLSSAELFDPATGKWTATGSMNTERQSFRTTMLTNGKVLVEGGLELPIHPISSSAELYDPSQGTWTTTSASMTNARYYHRATLLLDGSVLITGGFNSSARYLSSSESYYPDIVMPATITLTDSVVLPNGMFQFNFTNTPGAIFSVWATANISLPFSSWIIIGGATEISPGQFQFADSQAINVGQRFYRVSSP